MGRENGREDARHEEGQMLRWEGRADGKTGSGKRAGWGSDRSVGQTARWPDRSGAGRESERDGIRMGWKKEGEGFGVGWGV